MPTAMLIAPSPGSSFLSRNGHTYTADNRGVIRDVPFGTEVQDLQSSGCNLVQPVRYPMMAINADLNTLEDQRFDTSLIGSGLFLPDKVVASGASMPLTAAAGSIYTRNNKEGDKIASLTFSALDGTTEPQAVVVLLDPTVAGKVQHGDLWFTMDTVQGEPATCTIFVYGDLVAV